MGQNQNKTGSKRLGRRVISRGLSRKRGGEVVEAAFLARASLLGFRVSKPWGDSDRYDFVVEGEQGFWRVQVKLTTYFRRAAYRVTLSARGKTYTAEDIDFLVVYIGPENLWYVLPVEMVASKKGLGLRPNAVRSKFNRYREAWCLLACSRKARGWKDIPVVCRCRELQARCAVCPNRM